MIINLDKFQEQFEEVKRNEEVLLNVLNNMVACQSDNFVFSKKLLDSWGEEKIEVFVINVCHHFWHEWEKYRISNREKYKEI